MFNIRRTAACTLSEISCWLFARSVLVLLNYGCLFIIVCHVVFSVLLVSICRTAACVLSKLLSCCVVCCCLCYMIVLMYYSSLFILVCFAIRVIDCFICRTAACTLSEISCWLFARSVLVLSNYGC